jgi:hypothetical protein
MSIDEQVQLGHQAGVPAQREVSVDAVFQRG